MCPKVSKCIPKQIKTTNMEPKVSQIEPRNLQKHQLRNRFKKLGVLNDSRDKKREFFYQNVSTNHIKNHFEKRSPQHMEFDAKGVPKWCQNRCPNSSKINAKIDAGKSLKLSNFMFSRMVKSFKIKVKTMVLEGLTGWVREQKMYQNRLAN